MLGWLKRRGKGDIGEGREEWMWRNGALLEDKRMFYFGGRYFNLVKTFSARDIQKAAASYSTDFNGGGGCFEGNNKKVFNDFNGVWYTGCLEGEKKVFLKVPLGLDEAINEIAVAERVTRWKTSLRLLGCCLETRVPTLVYEYPVNGNLEDRLINNPNSLSWKHRLNIGNGIALLVAYLHIGFPLPIIHADLRTEHFYLDQDLCAKLSDLSQSGMAVREGRPPGKRDRFVAPEVLSRGNYSEKSDVYALGFILLNLIAGERHHCISLSNINDFINSETAAGIDGIVDPAILAEVGGGGGGGGVQHQHHQCRALLRLVLDCCETDPKQRPYMIDVAKQLAPIVRTY